MRALAKVMLFGGFLLFLLAAYSQTGQLTRADQVGDVLAMGMSLLVVVTGLVFLLVTRDSDRPLEEPGLPAGGSDRRRRSADRLGVAPPARGD